LALQGTLDAFPLPDLLRILATTNKTGYVLLESERGRGGVWFDRGAVVGIATDRATGQVPLDELLFELLRYQQGGFRFIADEAPHQPIEPQELEAILRRATHLLEEWRTLEQIVPSLEHEVVLAPALRHEQILINADCWSTLVAIGDGRTIGALAERLGLGELGVSRTLRDLVELGIVVIEPPAGRAPVSAVM
jgi:Domain of unknown function (DUF4388)